MWTEAQTRTEVVAVPNETVNPKRRLLLEAAQQRVGTQEKMLRRKKTRNKFFCALHVPRESSETSSRALGTVKIKQKVILCSKEIENKGKLPRRDCLMIRLKRKTGPLSEVQLPEKCLAVHVLTENHTLISCRWTWRHRLFRREKILSEAVSSTTQVGHGHRNVD